MKKVFKTQNIESNQSNIKKLVELHDCHFALGGDSGGVGGLGWQIFQKWTAVFHLKNQLEN